MSRKYFQGEILKITGFARAVFISSLSLCHISLWPYVYRNNIEETD